MTRSSVTAASAVTSPIRSPKKLIAEIIALTMRAPSWMNTQPWNFTAVTGEPLNRIRAGNTERMIAQRRPD
ncbi:Nitroreductase family protein [Tardiphaga sp. OK245]|nr:Nitroreductase family protein [Tardiphaga sp. OK245]